MNKKITRQEKGITLIALIITIVVLLILAVVTINSIQGDGIIRYAENAADEYTAKSNEEQEKLNTLFGQIEGSLKEKITWTKTSTGDLAIGSIVKTSTNEEFYVIGGDTAGTPITSSTEKVLLLAKNNLKKEGDTITLKQDTAVDVFDEDTGYSNACAFSSTDYWSSETTYPADLNDTEKYPIPEGATSIVTIAKTYGASLGATGRLMTVEEVEALGGSYENHSISDCPDYMCSLRYWLGSATTSYGVCCVIGNGSSGWLRTDSYYDGSDDMYGMGSECGVRPVVEILMSNIS